MSLKKDKFIMNNDEKQILIKGKKLSQPEITYLLSIKPDDINKDLLESFFAYKKDKDPRFSPQDKFILPKNTLYNDKDIQTNVGRYIVNLHLLAVDKLGKILGYINKPFDKGVTGWIDSTLAKCLLNDEINNSIYFEYIDRLQWIGYTINHFMVASMNLDLIELPEKTQELKNELLSKYEDKIKDGDTKLLNKVQDELLDSAKKEIKDNPSYEIYASGAKGKFSNNYKVSSIIRGEVKNLGTGESSISTDSLVDGNTPENLDILGDLLVSAPYSRAVDTQKGGYENKKLSAAFQSVVLDEKGSDCHTDKTIKVYLTENNIKDYLYRYIVENKQLIEITEQNKNQYINKTVNMRTPLYCNGKYYCNKCSGNLYYKIGIKNMGLTAGVIGSTILNLSMKSFHDSTINYTNLKLLDSYIEPISD